VVGRKRSRSCCFTATVIAVDIQAKHTACQIPRGFDDKQGTGKKQLDFDQSRPLAAELGVRGDGSDGRQDYSRPVNCYNAAARAR